MRRLFLVLMGCVLLAGTVFAKGNSKGNSNEYLDKLQGTWTSETSSYVFDNKEVMTSDGPMPMTYKVTKITEAKITVSIKGVPAPKITWAYSFKGDDLYINGKGPYKKSE